MNILKKIRRNFLERNKFGNYLIYAIGEIILVIVGILLALQINQYYQKKESEKRFHLMLENVQKELEYDINHLKKAIVNFATVDSLIYLNYIHHSKPDSLSKASQNHNFFPHLQGVSTMSSQSSFLMLLQNQDIIPNEQIKLLHTLNYQYNTLYESILRINNKVDNMVLENRKYYLDNFGFEDEKYFEFISENPKYKNDLFNFWSYAGNLVAIEKEYKSRAMNNHFEIARILGQDTTQLSYMPKKEKLENYLGSYINPLDSVQLKLSIEGKNLLLENTDNGFYPQTDEKLYLRQINDTTFYFSQSNLFTIIRLKNINGHPILDMPKNNERILFEKIN